MVLFYLNIQVKINGKQNFNKSNSVKTAIGFPLTINLPSLCDNSPLKRLCVESYLNIYTI